MPRKPRIPGLLLRRGLLVAAGFLTTVGTPAVATDQDQQATDQMRADCRSEGEAGGLQGTELETYIRDCIQDLLTVEISNLEE